MAKISKPKLKVKKLSPYKQFLLGKDKNYQKYKQKYFEFYDDVKDKTHRIYDW